jgi:DNA-binding NtrC family response regulator
LLVADDSAIIRKIMCKMLDKINIKYQMCNDGLDASQWFRSHAKDCAGVITDLEMPKMGGGALVEVARSVNPSLPCYIVSGNEIAQVNLPAGVRRAIVKPVSVEQIISVLSEILSLQIEAQEQQLEAQQQDSQPSESC